ncbi:hypothetical protein C8Q80DRAFT_832200 [Daedaleopsis nitida]|nr:hypothetical protein C8Q80DRAFT_832200 [Daedaleopsis nitida]
MRSAKEKYFRIAFSTLGFGWRTACASRPRRHYVYDSCHQADGFRVEFANSLPLKHDGEARVSSCGIHMPSEDTSTHLVARGQALTRPHVLRWARETFIPPEDFTSRKEAKPC